VATTAAVVPVVAKAPIAKSATATATATATAPAIAAEPKPASKPSVKIDASPVAVATVADGKSAPAPEATVASDASATVADDAAEATEAVAPARWLDGYYTGWGQSRHGDIQAFVRIEKGRIIEAGVASCETRYPCDVIDHIIPQPVERQSADVDRVSRATESADAYYNGLVMALEHAESGTYRSTHP
jgi:uncharacterized protein with FMN-binding domain